MNTRKAPERKLSYERLEAPLQGKIIKYMESDGWYVIKVIQCNKNGMTDLICLKNGRAVFLEVKRPGEKPDPLQLYRHEQLRKQNFTALWTDSWEHFNTLYKEEIGI